MADIHGVPDASMMIPVRPGETSGPLEDMSGMTAAAVSLADGPRQDEAQAILESPQGAGAMNVISGGTAGWPAGAMPGDPLNPIQGSGDYPAGM